MRETPAPPQRHSQLLGICLLYLLLPNILFLVGWVEPWLAWPLAALLSAGCWLLWRRSTFAPRAPMTRRDKVSLALCLLAGAAIVYLMGFNGDFPQSNDFIVRNAVYSALVNDTWPLHSARGEYFVYYHAFVLPPAALGKLIGGMLPAWLFQALWVYLGLALVIICLHRRAGRRTLSLLVCMFGLACMQELLGRADVFARYIPGLQGLVDAYWSLVPQPLYYVGMWHQLVATYNHAVPVLLFLAMVHAKLLPWHTLLPVSALVVVSSPLGAVVLLVYLAFKMLPCMRRDGIVPAFRHALLYVSIPLLVLLGLYYSSGEGSQCLPAWQSAMFAGETWKLMVAYGLGTLSMLLPLCVFGWRYRHTTGFRVSLLLLLALPWFWTGVDQNELLLKGSILPYFFMAVFLHGAWKHAALPRRCVYLLLFAACAYIPFLDIQHRLREFGTSPQQHELNIRNEWHGHLNNPEHEWYSRFWGPQAPPLFRP